MAHTSSGTNVTSNGRLGPATPPAPASTNGGARGPICGGKPFVHVPFTAAQEHDSAPLDLLLGAQTAAAGPAPAGAPSDASGTAWRPKHPADVPVLRLDGDLVDPISFVEAHHSIGSGFGAVKVVCPPKMRRALETWAGVDTAVPSFALKTQQISPKSTDLAAQLRFYKELIKFHKSADPPSVAGAHDSGANGTRNDHNPVEIAPSRAEDTGSTDLRPENISAPAPPDPADGESGTAAPTVAAQNTEDTAEKKVLQNGSVSASTALQSNPDPQVWPVLREADAESQPASAHPKKVENPSEPRSFQPKEESTVPTASTLQNEIKADSLPSIQQANLPIHEPSAPDPPNPTLDKILGEYPSFKVNIPGENSITLYSLFKAGTLFGGYSQIQQDNSWELVARELGYKANSVATVAPTLAQTYEKTLFPFEAQLSSPVLNPEGKRLRESDNVQYLLGSAKEYKRSVKSKLSKGFVPNFLSQIDIKPPVFLPPSAQEAVKPSEDKNNQNKSNNAELFQYPISAQAQLNHVIANTLRNQAHIDDPHECDSGPSTPVMNLRQIAVRDEKYRALLLQNKHSSSVEALEEIYWHTTSNDAYSYEIPEMILGSQSESVVGSIFPRIDDALNGHKIGSPKFNETPKSDAAFIENALHPWNLSNISTAPNSLLASLSDHDVCSDSITRSSVSVGTTFSTSNWSCEDHFTQKIDLLYKGSPKQWFFIAEAEFDKFETLLESLLTENSNNSKSFAESADSSNIKLAGLEYEVLIESAVEPSRFEGDVRLQHANETFQKLIDYRKWKNSTWHSQSIVITPETLDKHNIKYHSTVQYPGEFIIQYPKTYSFSYSLGVNVSQAANFASPLWLSYAIESEAWLKKRNILPNFSVFKLLINIIQLYDTGQTSKIHFNSGVYQKVADTYKQLFETELELRSEIRRQTAHLKEAILDEKVFSSIEAISDDSLTNAYPSKIVLTHTSSKRSFTIALADYLEYCEVNKRDEKDTQKQFAIVRSSEMKVELQLYYSDEKLRTFYRSIVNNVSNYSVWMRDYEKLMSETDELPLKTYRTLLGEGEKVLSAMSSPYHLEAFEGSGTSTLKKEVSRIHQFKACIINLRAFIDHANWYIDECQNILAIKHQQRIRNNDDTSSSSDEDLLPRLLKVLGMIPTLNFTCSETEQILEFKNEIENFDIACRTFVTKPRQTMQEINDLINLGKSFGINLKSLEYIVRVKDRLKWIENFEIIIKGGDPFNDRKHKKQVFSLADLEEFYELGLKNLGKEDVHRIEVIDSMIRNSYMYDNKIISFLGADDVDNIKIEDVDRLIDEIESKFKLKGEKRIFINLEKLDDLYDFRSGLEVLSKFFDFRDRVRKRTNYEPFSYHDVKALQNELSETKLPIKEAHHKLIANQLKKTANFIKQCENLFNEKLISSVMYSEFYELRIDYDKKLTVSEPLMTALQRLIQKCETSFAIDGDSYTKSSSYQEAQVDDKIVEDMDGHIQTYCVCREGERGTMIECETCKEWYHSDCVETNDEAKAPVEDYATATDLDHKSKINMKKESKSAKTAGAVNNPESANVVVVKQEANDGIGPVADQPRAENEVIEKNEKIKTEPHVKEDGIKEDGDDAYSCPVCELVKADIITDAHLAKTVTQLRLISLVEEGRKLSVYPPNEWSKLKELNDLVCRSSQHIMVELERIKQAGDPIPVKLDKARFLLRKVYGAGILLEDFYYDLVTTVKKFSLIEKLEKGQIDPVYETFTNTSVPASVSSSSPKVSHPVATPLPEAGVGHESSEPHIYSFKRQEQVRQSSATPYSQTEDTVSVVSKVSSPSQVLAELLDETSLRVSTLESRDEAWPAVSSVSPTDEDQTKQFEAMSGVEESKERLSEGVSGENGARLEIIPSAEEGLQGIGSDVFHQNELKRESSLKPIVADGPEGGRLDNGVAPQEEYGANEANETALEQKLNEQHEESAAREVEEEMISGEKNNSEGTENGDGFMHEDATVSTDPALQNLSLVRKSVSPAQDASGIAKVIEGASRAQEHEGQEESSAQSEYSVQEKPAVQDEPAVQAPSEHLVQEKPSVQEKPAAQEKSQANDKVVQVSAPERPSERNSQEHENISELKDIVTQLASTSSLEQTNS